MPSLEVSGPELQALDAITSFIVPLIDSSIAEGIKNAKRLVVHDSLRFLRIELRLLPFWITKGQVLNDQEYEAFLQDLQPVLQLLEDFIDPKAAALSKGGVPDPTTSEERRRYPKLHGIIQIASQSKDQLNFKTAINLPDSEDEARKACEIVTEFNANNKRRDDGDHSESTRTQADQKSMDFHSEHPCMRQPRPCSSMFKAWAHHFGASGCEHDHVGMLQARAVELDGSGPQKVVQHEMFISTCEPEDKWQKVTCTIVGNLPENASSLCEIDDICQTIGKSLSDEEILRLWICSERIWHDTETDPEVIDNVHILPTLSLQNILQTYPDMLGPNDRATLAYNLACTLLQIYSADMQQQEWEPGDIYFLHNPNEGTIHEPDNPFVASTFLSNRTPIEIKNRFPVLIHFAKLLLEIGMGQLFVPRRSRLEFELMKWAQSAEANQSLIGSYLDAVMECLQAKKPRQMDDPMDEETQCRKVIFNLVSHLKKVRHSYLPLDPKRVQKVSMLDSTSTESAVQHMPPQQRPLSQKDLSELLPKKRMFDEQKLHPCDADKSSSEISSSTEFLESAKRFYDCSTAGLTSTPNIRIAILDTGIQTKNSFFKGAKRSRSGKDSPIKASKSFVSESPDDECGHGTNVASLILKIFPEANLYIAKIARNLEQDGVDQMVKAIEWARSCNVHIINMSFSIPKASAVKRIIREAEKDGVIVFVAASNNGANTGRSFPATLDTVLCIHANDGKGNKGSMNPEPEPNRDNLSTLGVAVRSVWENDVYLSGTSYATPVAAAIAAVILYYVEAAVAANQMPKESKEEVFDRAGMKSILLSMSVLRDGYNCIIPWREFLPPGAKQDVLAASIRSALN